MTPSLPSSFQNQCNMNGAVQTHKLQRRQACLKGQQSPPPQVAGPPTPSSFDPSKPCPGAKESPASPAVWNILWGPPGGCSSHLLLCLPGTAATLHLRQGWAEPTSQTPDSVLSFNEEPGQWGHHSPQGPPAAHAPHHWLPRRQAGPEAASPAEGSVCSSPGKAFISRT